MPQFLDENVKKKASYLPTVVASIVPFLIGLAIAYVIYGQGATSKYDVKIQTIKTTETYWIYLALVFLGRAVSIVNLLPAYFKNQILNKGNIRANPFIYKVMDGGHVLFDEDGVIGQYNRGNRSLHHMIETLPLVLAGLFAAGQVFPFPTFILISLISFGRIIHSLGYSYKGYGGHAPGFLLAFLATSIL